MHDMLVKLYDLKNDWTFIDVQEKLGITIRKPIGPEKSVVVNWARVNFAEAWANEVDVALSNMPFTCYVAIEDKEIIGFACYDSTALGMFGPTGISEKCRGKGTGKALLLACMLDMKLKGYAYTVIGGVGPAEFYRKAVNAVIIPDSGPGIYKGLLKKI